MTRKRVEVGAGSTSPTSIDRYPQHLFAGTSALHCSGSDRGNGDGNVNVVVRGSFNASTRVRVGSLMLDASNPNFKQNDHYIRFVAPADALALNGAMLVNSDGTEGPIRVAAPGSGSDACPADVTKYLRSSRVTSMATGFPL